MIKFMRKHLANSKINKMKGIAHVALVHCYNVWMIFLRLDLFQRNTKIPHQNLCPDFGMNNRGAVTIVSWPQLDFESICQRRLAYVSGGLLEAGRSVVRRPWRLWLLCVALPHDPRMRPSSGGTQRMTGHLQCSSCTMDQSLLPPMVATQYVPVSFPFPLPNGYPWLQPRKWKLSSITSLSCPEGHLGTSPFLPLLVTDSSGWARKHPLWLG